jgi:agmatine deiminase
MAQNLAPSLNFPPPIPAEWAPHKALWTAFPSDPDLWMDDLENARKEFAALARALAKGVKMRVLASGNEAVKSATSQIGDVADILPVPFGDIWLRDTGPIFGSDAHGKPLAHLFRFNGWGGKYIMKGDEEVGAAIADISNTNAVAHDFIMEGGSLDMDGAGTCLTTRQCLLNPNRNKGWSTEKIEKALGDALSIRTLLWLDEGLEGDHTDGHIDNIARFVAPGKVVCQHANGADDPNAATLKAIEEKLCSFKDAQGRNLEVITIPSPGRVNDVEGQPAAASHMNFIITNKVVAVPVYNEKGAAAVTALTRLFPGREVVGLSARAILSGGGAFHCITQQEPA